MLRDLSIFDTKSLYGFTGTQVWCLDQTGRFYGPKAVRNTFNAELAGPLYFSGVRLLTGIIGLK